ncbi:unnamed protein product [Schistosoma margrebowiei]|uniref:Uncharacterized protein n=1 Tax=Schistosoma margrebowiei TaxID=48269 RepID=A0A183MBQ8_9TREM|nr:unnamed protein product [Schistosoma margrebowiei]
MVIRQTKSWEAARPDSIPAEALKSGIEDTVIFERLACTSLFTESTMDHLENFAKTGLRTLCIAWTEVDPAFYNKWVGNFYKASTALNDREAKLESVANEIEQVS